MKNKIKELVDSKGITPYQFMKDLGIAQVTAYGLYNDRDRLPSAAVLSKICDFYLVDANRVLDWVPPSSEQQVTTKRRSLTSKK